MSVALVQGANRGLGLSLVKILAAKSPVVATCRRPEVADELQRLKNVEVLQLDVTRENDISKAAQHVKDKYGSLDLLINNAGLLHPSGKGETRLSDVKFEDLEALYAINAAGPLIMARYFAPLLQKGTKIGLETLYQIDLSGSFDVCFYFSLCRFRILWR